MSDTIKDYLVGFGFDVDDSGAGQIESMLTELDSIVRNLAQVLTQATEKMQGFVSNVQSQAQAAGQSSGDVEGLADNTRRFSEEADGGSRAASALGKLLSALGGNASQAGSGLSSAGESASSAANKLSDVSRSASEAKEGLSGASEQIDQTGESADKASSAVDGLSNALKTVQGVLKAIAGAAVVNKFLSIARELYEYDQGLAETAKSLGKTTEQARAHTKALEAMGKTYDEVQKDKKLKATYDELVAIGESMALPEAEDGIDNIGAMVDSFTRLKMIGSYAMQWLYHTVQDVASGPLRRFKETIDEIADLFKTNLPKLTLAGGHILDGVLRIVSAFAKGAVKIVEFLGKLPGPMKLILGLIAAAGILIKTGPFGWMVTVLTSIGLLLDDFFGYLEGENAALGPFWDTCIQAFNDIKEGLTAASEAIQCFFEASKGEDGKVDWIGFGGKVGQWILDGIKQGLGDLSTKLKGWITGDENANWDAVGEALVGKVETAIQTALDVGNNILAFLVGLVDGLITPESVADLLTNGSKFVEGIFKGITNTISTIGDSLNATVQLLLKGILGLVNKITSNDVMNGVGDFATAFITGIGAAIGQAITSAGKILDGITDMLGEALTPDNISRINANLDTLGARIIEALVEAIKKAADGATNLIDAIGGLFAKLLNPDENDKTILQSMRGFGTKIIKAIVTGIGKVSDAGARIMRAIGDAIRGIDWSQAGTDLGGIVTGLVDSIVNGVSDGSLQGKFEDLMGAIGSGLNKAISALAEFGLGLANALIDYMLEPETWARLGEGLMVIINTTFGGILSFLDELLGGELMLDTEESVEHVNDLETASERVNEALDELNEKEIDPTDSEAQARLEYLNGLLLQLEEQKELFLENWSTESIQEAGQNIQTLVDNINKGDGTPEQIKAWQEQLQGYISMLEFLSQYDLGGTFRRNGMGVEITPELVANYAGVDSENMEDSEFQAIYKRMMDDIEKAMQAEPVIADVPVEPEPTIDNPDALAEGVAEAVEESVQNSDTPSVGVPVDIEPQPEIKNEPDFGSLINEGYAEEGMTLKRSAKADINLEGVTVTPGDGTQLEDATQETIDAIIGEHTFSADVTVKTNLTVEVEDSNAEAIGTAIGTGIGRHMSTALSGSDPLSGLLDEFSATLDELLDKVDKIVSRIKAKFSAISTRASSVFSSVASSAKTALGALPEWIQLNVVDKINQSLGTIKVPNINLPNSGGGAEPHSSEGRQVDHEMVTRVGEGGKREYIIPVTKPDRGIPLLKRAAADLGLTVESYANATKLLGGSPDRAVTPAHAVAASTSNSVVNHYNTIDAHADITVSGSGDPRSTANNVNSSHEQVLLRNVKPLLG